MIIAGKMYLFKGMEDGRNERLPYRNEGVSIHEFVRFKTFFCLFVLFYSFIISTNYRFSHSLHFHPYNVNTWIKRFVCVLFCLETFPKQDISFSSPVI